MRASLLLGCVVLVFALPAVAQTMPEPLVRALTYLGEQRSYSWESINTDPGPVEHTVQTRRGAVSVVQQSTSPNVRGSLDRNGDTLLQREWSDGMRLDTFVPKSGLTVTRTPEGWLGEREILALQTEESVRGGDPARLAWLRRADRPDIRRPDQELVPLLNARTVVEQPESDTYILRARIRRGVSGPVDPEDNSPTVDITLTIRVRSGLVRDYDVAIEGTQLVGRSRVSVSDHRTVILSYVPVSRVDVPAEARAKAADTRR